MRHFSILFVAIPFAAVLAGCRRHSSEMHYQSSGYTWHFVGTPGQPRAIIRIEEESPHTILITEGRFLNSSESMNSGDARITLYNKDSPEDTRTVDVPTGRAALIDNSGIFTLLDEDIISWNGESLEYTPRAFRFDGVLRSLITNSNQQDRQAEQAGAGQPATRPESKSEGMDKPQPDAEGRSR
jgi:hypothetical protein